MSYLLSAVIITLIIPIWGLIMQLIHNLLYGLLKRLIGTKTAMFVSNWLTFPGVIHHELSHAILAFFTGAKITELKLFWPDKKTGTLGQVSFVPRGVFIFRCIQMTLASSAPVILGSLTSYILIEVIRSGDYPIYITAIIVYLIFSILIHAYMSIADVKIMLKGIWTLFFVILAMCFVFHVDITQL